MKACIESGLWVPNSRTDDTEDKEGDKEEDGTYEELKTEVEKEKVDEEKKE